MIGKLFLAAITTSVMLVVGTTASAQSPRSVCEFYRYLQDQKKAEQELATMEAQRRRQEMMKQELEKQRLQPKEMRKEQNFLEHMRLLEELRRQHQEGRSS
jgi:hypothetical protein